MPSGGAGSTARVRAVEPGAARPTPQPRPLPTPGPAPVARVAPPPLPASPEGGLTEESARNLSATIDRLPVRDPGAALTPGPAPQLQLAGDADPGQVSAQQAQLAEGTAHAQAEGARDAAEPMGEDAVRPTVAVETFEADVGAGGAAGGAAGSAGPAAATAGAGGGPGGDGAAGEDAAVDAVVEEQQGPALRAAAAAGSARMTAARQQHADQEQAQRAQSAQQVAALEAQHAEAEATQRADVRAEVTGQRTAWRAEQDALAAGAHAEARVVSADAGATVAGERARAQTEAAQAHAQGQEEAAQARQEGEQEAARARASAKEESSGGFFGWLASKATALFDKVKAGISAAFEKARQAVKAAVEKAQALATAVIEKARQAVVAAIRLAGAALTAIGDRLLAAFPAVRERFRNAIRAAVQRAEAAVNRLAEGLKAGVRAALGLLGRALTALLDGLEAGLKAAVNAVAATVTAAINAAKAALAAIGAFLAVAKDVAANPGAWLRNLGAAVVDGIRNHLWKALKTAVQQWFNDKVEQVLGLGRAVWNLLTKGGISLAKIGAMAWEGLKAAIPPALIGLLVEKLVSMIVPAAGAVLAIVQGLQAAWGTVSRILQAIDKFITFLKAVKSGSGGPAFADVLAAAAITVVDFVSNWLLARLAKGASTVAGKIRDIARKIGAALKKVATKVGGALKKLGRKIGARLKGLRDRFRSWRDRRRVRRGADKGAGTKADEQARKQQRLDRAVAAIKPAATQMLTKGVSPLRFRAALAYWRIRYRLTSLTLSGDGSIVATVNPTTTLDDPKGKQVPDAELAALLLPVFVKAEQQYREQLAAAPTANAQLEFDFARASAQGYADPGSPGSLEGLNRFQQADVLANQRPGSNKRQVERGVSIWTPTAAYDDWSPATEGGAALVGFVDPSGGRYNPPPKIKRGKKLTDKLLEQLKTKREKGMTARLRREAAALGLSEADVAGALAGSRRSDVESLRSRMTPATTKAGAKKRESFIAKLHGQNVLSHSVETGRREGMRTTIAMGMTLLGMPRVDADGNPLLGPEGRPQTVASLHDVLQGRMAPMAPEGSASRAKKPEKRVLPRLEPIPATEPGGKPKRRKAKTQYATVPELAERQRLRAVGRIFATLLETAKSRPVLASPRGHDLKALATAIEMFLGARLRRHPSPDELAAAQALLQGELVAFLANFHGR
ncbi:hypothetical protein [Cellulomonas fimi]|uniref:hypothetical protein n=1 Tax=Cellulomonas fimi TaxID=1708 RepID=UPI00145DE730|nr:hypothetical protein [Cellulomonas fimi]